MQDSKQEPIYQSARRPIAQCKDFENHQHQARSKLWKLTLAGWLPPPPSGTKRESNGSVGDQLKSSTLSTFSDFLSRRPIVSVSYTLMAFLPILAKYLSSRPPPHLQPTPHRSSLQCTLHTEYKDKSHLVHLELCICSSNYTNRRKFLPVKFNHTRPENL